MKAITLWQPWASLLACGAKQYETRSWATNHRGLIAIHAAVKDAHSTMLDLPQVTTKAMYAALYREMGIASGALARLPYGCVIATAWLAGCWEICIDGGEKGDEYHPALDSSYHATVQEQLFGDWEPGRFAWELVNVKMLSTPIPAKGRQGLWNWEPPDTQEGASQ